MNFSFEDYQELKAKAASNSNQQKVGYFKLKNNGDRALVRICCESLNDLMFVNAHPAAKAEIPGIGQKWPKVSCLNTIGSFEDKCPICAAVAAGDTTVFQKAKKYCYIKMLVAYEDPTTHAFGTSTPVIWERSASYSTEIANKLNLYGTLKDMLFVITRNGVAGDTNTTYQLDPAPDKIFKPELVPADFSAFENFDISRHSYYNKSLEDTTAFYTTGSFPEVVKQNQTNAAAQTQTVNQAQTSTATPAAQANVAIQSTGQAAPTFTQAEANPFPTAQDAVRQAPATAEEATQQAPVRNFGQFTF